jgi:hypothetical protein
MATVNEVVTDAMEDLVVQASEAPIEGDEGRSGIRALNDRMFAWDAMGINLGYTKVDNMADVLTVPDGAIMGIKAQLAIDLAEKYDVDVKLGVVKRAVDGFKAIQNLSGLEAKSMAFPSTLPIGSGNEDELNNSTHFYPEAESTIQPETGGSIALEDSTEEA